MVACRTNCRQRSAVYRASIHLHRHKHRALAWIAAAIAAALVAVPSSVGGRAAPESAAPSVSPDSPSSDPAEGEQDPIESTELPDPGAAEGPAAPSSIRWRRSRALGKAYDGRLVNGVRLPEEGEHFFTWDPIRRTSPNRGWRRYGTDRLVRIVLEVSRDFRLAHPDAPRIGVGDLSRPRGGGFGPRFGWPGHASHQNGLDVDIYYPRQDGIERAPLHPKAIDRPLSQDLVDRFVEAGAQFVFVGFRVGLRGPRRIVQRIPRHENHLHVRIYNLP
jgi:penicillin-insensitive murein endopeptidase